MGGIGICRDAYLGEFLQVFGALRVVNDLVVVAVGDGCIVGRVGPLDAIVYLLPKFPHQFLLFLPCPLDHLAGMRPQQSKGLLAFNILTLHG
jgi:hypothetical protein